MADCNDYMNKGFWIYNTYRDKNTLLWHKDWSTRGGSFTDKSCKQNYTPIHISFLLYQPIDIITAFNYQEVQKAYEKIENSTIKELLVTDSIPLKKESTKINVISIADVFAEVINKVYNYQSISNSFIQ